MGKVTFSSNSSDVCALRFGHVPQYWENSKSCEETGETIHTTRQYSISEIIIEPRHEKSCFRPGKTQTGLLSYTYWLESWNYGYRKWRY